MMKKILTSFIVLFILFCQQTFGQNSNIPIDEKPEMVVVSANYSLILGYDFYIEHRGSQRTGRKELYKKMQSEIRVMGNPSDAVNFMNKSGYQLLQVYSFPTSGDNITVNYVYKKKTQK